MAKVPEVSSIEAIELSVRKPVIIVAMVLIAGFFIPLFRMVLEMSGEVVIGAAGAAFLLGWYLIVCFQALRARITVQAGPETLRIAKNDETIYDGPYFAARRTMLPHIGIGFAIPPLPLTQTLSLNFSNTFIVSFGRNRITLPGGMLKGLDRLWEAVPDHLKQ